jgi:N-acyl-D-amino-acid deacylase
LNHRLAAALLAVAALAGPSLHPAPNPPLLLRGGQVVDGTGAAARAADVRIFGDRIVDVAPALLVTPEDRVVDVTGLVVAPGFIDMHSHVDRQVFALPAASQTAQGITTAVVGVDGAGPYPVGAFLDRLAASPAALNIATLVGHASVRRAVMGEARRRARPGEVRAMAERVSRALDEGAFGLSSGLEYEPGFQASPAEIAALAREAAPTLYATHVRSEGDSVFDALAEAVDVGRSTGIAVHVSHLKLASAATRGRAVEVLALLGAVGVDVTADWYPYSFWVSTTSALAPARGRGDREHWARVIADAGGAGRLTITAFAADRSYEGRTVAEVAAERGWSAADLLRDLERRGHAGLAGQVMDEGDLEDFLRSPRVMIASDGGIRVAHPRGAGTFPRVLARYVRERGVITLESAIHKMTGMPAQRLGLRDRGRIAPGAQADVVVFDPATIADRATALLPHLAPVGIVHVLVNGVAVVWDGKPTVARPGRALRRPLLPGNVGHEEPLDGRSVPQVGVADLGEVARSHPPVPHVVGINGHGDAAAAMLQAAGAADDDPAPEPAVAGHCLQLLVEGGRALGRAGALGVVRRPLVDAHQHVTLGLGHRPPRSRASIVGRAAAARDER